MAAEPIVEVERLLREALARRGVTGDDAEFIVADLTDAQLEGKATHGVAKIFLIDSALAERQGEPVVRRRRPGMVLVDGRRELGHLAGRLCARLAVELASEGGTGLVSLTNAGRFGRLAPYGRLIADHGLVGFVTNNAGPPAVAPFGSRDPVLGTNPVCFAFPPPPPPPPPPRPGNPPGNRASLVIDLSTAARVWGEVRGAVLEGRPLPPGAFLDQDGQPTRDAENAAAVQAFGGHKGSALCLALELLCGALSGGRMGREVDSEYDLGVIFLAVALLPTDDPGAQERLVESIRGSRPAPGHQRVLVPGDRAAARRAAALAAGVVDVHPATMSRLRRMARSDEGGLEPSDRLN
ncbi:MAG: Ldh family oxidoreductase [Actinobacteria bacterium]|nr:Ldh family oxidoreductase [Actinomycetota bacterium]